ncbi:MAG TPA: ASCH domain-containing protein [Streptosporangiaceae bacterium]|nr:ASCH domain-containing protein [Streptosporangiaceae bacterium]
MQLLSVRQPWAWAIARGRKPVENRNWAPPYRGKLAIYASMHVDLQACESPLIWSADWDPDDPVAAIGGIVAVVTLADVCSAAISGTSCDCGEWARPKAHHWRLTDPQPLTRPVVSIGRSARMADVIPMRIVASSELSGLSAEETRADQYGLWEPEPAVVAEVTAGLA